MIAIIFAACILVALPLYFIIIRPVLDALNII